LTCTVAFVLGRVALALTIAGLAAVPSTAAAQERPDRFSLAGGCFTATGAPGAPVAERVRLKATALGRYLLYRPDATFVAAQPDGSLGVAAAPSPAADFAVEEAGGDTFRLAPQSTRTTVATVRFAPAEGCAQFPEAGLDAVGTPATGATEYGRVQGVLEGHMHWMAYDYFGGRFRCGRPWHAYGIAAALPDCADNEGPQGTAAPLQNTLNYDNPAQPHDTAGFPTLPNQSKDNLTYEGMYYRWVERVYKAGLRLMVMGVNENRVLCELQANRTQSCNEMDTMRRGFTAIRELQDYVDAQAGGPGKGFFEVVTDPFEARRVINEGRMAVVLEIETSEPFDCAGTEQPTCDKEQIDRQIDEMHRLGVRSSLLLNKFDNPLSGVRFDAGTTGLLINAGNKVSAGTFWSARTCRDELSDNEIDTGQADASAALDSTFSGLGVPGGTLPVYPPAPHCNTRGLTELGRHVVKRMMDLGWIVNPDHMSQAAVDDTLTLLESRNYSGVISPHGWVDPGNWPRLWKLGGMAFPGHSATDQYVQDYQDFRPRETPFEFGWGYGADLGGLSHQPDKSARGSISYPFKSYDGTVSFDRQTTGERTFDFTKEGVAHYGLYAEWLEDLRRVGGQELADDMSAGAEAYLQMWERASGVESKRCFFRQDGLKRTGRGPIRLGDDWEAVLARAGQPQQRDRAWSWCVKGKDNRRAADVAVLSQKGTVQLVGSTARGRNALGVGIGRRASAIRRARSAGGGVFVRRSGRRAFVWSTRNGRVRAVGVTTAKLAADRPALRSAMRRVVRARADNRPKGFVPAEAQAKPRMLGRSLAQTGDGSKDAQQALFCSLNL
jgi:microsomal dipeptidase-like Zn-dependent dipeptidase